MKLKKGYKQTEVGFRIIKREKPLMFESGFSGLEDSQVGRIKDAEKELETALVLSKDFHDSQKAATLLTTIKRR
ncbi:hypothetical protein QUF76_07765 [Desulfobacterales bacterium HSG16]|nr:hypothetical protein [Desulfobacterales bacterium HSG16]